MVRIFLFLVCVTPPSNGSRKTDQSGSRINPGIYFVTFSNAGLMKSTKIIVK